MDDAALPGRIFLVGPMGSGKTTIGRLLARRLDRPFRDTDAELEARTGASINLIFDVEGEDGFRDRETDMLQRLSEEPTLVLATGGGIVVRERNRELLAERGFVVWLQTTVDQQLRRLARDRSRPLLQAPNRRERLERLAAERDPLYAAIADLVFPTRDRSVRATAQQLAQAIRDDVDASAH